MDGVAEIQRKHSAWVYLLPGLHLCGCLMLPLGYVVHLVIPQSDYVFGSVWGLVIVADLPVSIVAYILAWKYSLLAAIWIFVAGTLWWYFLSRVIESALRRFQDRRRDGSSFERLDI